MKNKEKEIFAERLSQALKKNDYSQKYLAHEADVSEGTISKYLNAETPEMPKADALARLAKALKVSTDYLLGISNRETAHDQITLTDIGQALLQCINTDALNLRTIEYTVEEFCADDCGEGGPDIVKRSNKYPAIYFSEWDQSDNPYDDYVFYSRYGAKINRFIQAALRWKELYLSGELTEEMYNQLIEFDLRKLGNDPLPKSIISSDLCNQTKEAKGE